MECSRIVRVSVGKLSFNSPLTRPSCANRDLSVVHKSADVPIVISPRYPISSLSPKPAKNSSSPNLVAASRYGLLDASRLLICRSVYRQVGIVGELTFRAQRSLSACSVSTEVSESEIRAT